MDKKQELLNQVAKLNEEAIQQMNARIGKIDIELGEANQQVNLLSSEKSIIEKNIKKLKTEIKLFTKSTVALGKMGVNTSKPEPKKTVYRDKKESIAHPLFNLVKEADTTKVNPLSKLHFRCTELQFKTNRSYHNMFKTYFRNFLVKNEYLMFEDYCQRINDDISKGINLQDSLNSIYMTRESIKDTIREYQRYRFDNPMTTDGYNSRWCVKKIRKALLFLINMIDSQIIPAIKHEQYKIR